MDVRWVQRVSWHAIREQVADEVTGEVSGRTFCGRVWHDHAAQTDTLPVGKSCETCLRIIARRTDKEPT